MGLKQTRLIETYNFATLDELRDFLNRFKVIDLSTVYPNESDNITLHWLEETLSDGSIVNNVTINT